MSESKLTPEQIEVADRILNEIAFEKKLLKAARSFHFGRYRVEWCGDHPTTREPRFCVKNVWSCIYRFHLDGSNEYEPLPSSRDDAFIERTNFSRDDAARLAERLENERLAKEREG